MTKFLLLQVLLSSVCFADIVFQREAITATIIACDTLEIQGIYYFVNNDATTMESSICYPFPVDRTLAYPHFISVMRLSNRQQIPCTRDKGAVVWNQTILPRSIDSVLVTYRQKAHQRKGRYILITTKYWKRPLEQAVFTVITPAAVTLAYWSFQSDSVKIRNGRTYYHAVKTDFLPTQDMQIEWNCKKK